MRLRRSRPPRQSGTSRRSSARTPLLRPGEPSSRLWSALTSTPSSVGAKRRGCGVGSRPSRRIRRATAFGRLGEMESERARRGRGAAANPTGRFERLSYEPALDFLAAGPDEDDPPALKTEFYRDPTREILAHNESPDVGFDTSVNPYRGCEHGCIYCYARPTHEYLGLSAGLDFESRIFVKEDAPQLLRRELSKPSWRPRVIAFSGVTDPYQPAERRLCLTRRCLEVMAAFLNPVVIVTKSHLVTRDLGLHPRRRARAQARAARVEARSTARRDPHPGRCGRAGGSPDRTGDPRPE